MKLRNIIASFLAVVAIAVGCTEELTGNLSSIQLDQSTIVLPEEGGSATITVTATSDWKVDAATVPAEVTITPMEGKAGETKMTISTVGSVNDINADIVILVGAQKQFVKLYQPGDPSMKPQFDEFTAGEYWIMCQEAGEWFALKSTGCTIDDSGSYNYLYSVPAVVAEDGSLSSTASNVFTFEAVEGGFIIKDPAGGYLYQVAKYNNFYLTSDKAQASVWTVAQVSENEFMLEIPDLSKWMQYSTSYDSAGAYPTAQEGATLPKLVKAEAPAEDPFVIEQTEFELPLEAGELLIPVTYNGSDIHVAELPTWLTFYGYHDGNIKFTYEANEGGNRVANVLLITCMEDGREAQVELTFTQEGAIAAVTVEEFLAAEEGAALYKLTGIVKNIASDVYGNFDLVDATGSVYVYGLTATQVASNDKSFGSLGIKEGDVITLIGTRTSFKETPQVGGPAYLVEHVVAATEATVTEFLAASNGTWCKVTGTIANLVNETYGNFDLVGEDGASVYVYGLTTSYVTKNDKSFANLGLKEGDVVTLVGKRDIYNEQDQVGGPAYYISHEAGAPAVDPWETAAVTVNGAEATDDARLKELRAYADADYLYVRLTAAKETPFAANHLDFYFTDGEGETEVWWGWTTTGTDIYYQEHKCDLDAETGALTKMRWYPVEGDRVYIDDYTTETTDSEVVWTIKFPRSYVDVYKSSTNTVRMSFLLWNGWDVYWAIPSRGSEMMEVTLP